MITAEFSREPGDSEGQSGNGTSAEVSSTQSELTAHQWAVISFEKCEAAELTYDEARKTLGELESRGISGLCIVTDEAAARIAS